MTTEEIHEKIQQCCQMSLEESCGFYLVIMEHMNNKIAELEKRIEELDRSTSHTANIASCLANGIQPD